MISIIAAAWEGIRLCKLENIWGIIVWHVSLGDGCLAGTEINDGWTVGAIFMLLSSKALGVWNTTWWWLLWCFEELLSDGERYCKICTLP